MVLETLADRIRIQVNPTSNPELVYLQHIFNGGICDVLPVRDQFGNMLAIDIKPGEIKERKPEDAGAGISEQSDKAG